VIERSDGFRGIGEVRANISYLSHIPESAVDPAIIALCRRLPWGAALEEILTATQELNAVVPHVATAAVENALVELLKEQSRARLERMSALITGGEAARTPEMQRNRDARTAELKSQISKMDLLARRLESIEQAWAEKIG